MNSPDITLATLDWLTLRLREEVARREEQKHRRSGLARNLRRLRVAIGTIAAILMASIQASLP